MHYILRDNVVYNWNARVTRRALSVAKRNQQFIYITKGNRCLCGDELLAATTGNDPVQYMYVNPEESDISEVTLRGNDVSPNPVAFATAAMRLFAQTAWGVKEMHRATGASMYQLETVLWLARVAPSLVREQFLDGKIAWPAIGNAARSVRFLGELTSRIARGDDLSTRKLVAGIAGAVKAPTTTGLYDDDEDDDE